ncbi:hypothetical protein DFH09DRAFT_1148072 [Mycena vulgaris]|nr:hypothetical protein DFH09DRAFT_1148072 [Mycena vulgaris]
MSPQSKAPPPLASEVTITMQPTYPVLTLPTEITTQIFVHCLPDSVSPPEIDAAPLLLGRICSGWRSIALGTPELWTSLKIARSDTAIELIETWLARAQNRPLSLALTLFEEDDSDEWDAAQTFQYESEAAQIIHVLQQRSHTWRDMKIILPFHHFYFFGSDLHLPMLERLTVELNDYDPPMDPVITFRNTPSLRHLHLMSGLLSTDMPLPWAQLTSFKSDSGVLSPEGFLDILQCIPNIVECAVSIHNGTELDRLPDVPPCMFLTSFSLSTHLTKVMDILDHISVPALQVLDLREILFSGRALLQPLHRFLYRLGCRLRELAIRIDGNKPQEEDFIQLLETQPELEQFELCEGSLELLIAVCRRLSDGSPFLPRLNSLTASPHIYPVEQITTTFPGMLDALAGALSTRLVAPPASFSQILNCTLSWSGAWTEDLDTTVAAFRPRQGELAARGVNMRVGN